MSTAPIDRRRAYRRAKHLSDASLSLLSDALGQLHGVSGATAYWRPIIGPWLVHFAVIYVDRVERQGSIGDNGSDATEARIPVDWSIPLNWSEFLYCINSPNFNEQLLSQAALFSGAGNETRYSDAGASKRGLAKEEKSDFLKRLFKKGPLELIRILSLQVIHNLMFHAACAIYGRRVVLLDPWLLKETTKIAFFIKSLGRITAIPKFQLSKFRLNVGRSANNDRVLRRKLLSLIPSQDEGLSVFLKVAIWNIPKVHIESFSKIQRISKRLRRKKPRAVLLNIGQYFDERLKVALADWRANGSLLLLAQHGGGYGLLEFGSYDDYELSLASSFYTWGWKNGRGIQKPLPSLRLSEYLRDFSNRRELSNHFLYVCGMYPDFQAENYQFTPYDNVVLRDGRSALVRDIPYDVRKKLIIRPYPAMATTVHGCNDVCEFQNAGFSIEDNVPSGIAFSRASLLIFETLSTGFFEALACDRPVVLYMPGAKLLPWSTLGREFLYLLAKGDMLFVTSESLSSFLQSDVSAWWNTDHRRYIREEIKKRFALTSECFVDDWIRELNGLNALSLNEAPTR